MSWQSEAQAVGASQGNERGQIGLQWLKQLEAETRSLCALLENEQAALRKRCLDVIMEVVAEKNLAVARINELLHHMPHQSDLQADFIQALLADLQPEWRAEAQATWKRICHLTARCRQLNEANGSTIAVLQEYNRRSLVLMLNQRRQQLGYRADGQVHTEAGARLLGAI